MADNYLEKQMEQYQARKAAWEKERKYGKRKTSGASPSKPKQPEAATDKSEKEVSPKDMQCKQSVIKEM